MKTKLINGIATLSVVLLVSGCGGGEENQGPPEIARPVVQQPAATVPENRQAEPAPLQSVARDAASEVSQLTIADIRELTQDDLELSPEYLQELLAGFDTNSVEAAKIVLDYYQLQEIRKIVAYFALSGREYRVNADKNGYGWKFHIAPDRPSGFPWGRVTFFLGLTIAAVAWSIAYAKTNQK